MVQLKAGWQRYAVSAVFGVGALALWSWGVELWFDASFMPESGPAGQHSRNVALAAVVMGACFVCAIFSASITVMGFVKWLKGNRSKQAAA